MKYTVQFKTLITGENKKLQDCAKKYPKTKVYRFELSDFWQPVDFQIEDFKETDRITDQLQSYTDLRNK